MLKEDIDQGLELLADVLTRPSFPEAEIEKQRQETLLAIRRLDENWQQEVERLFRRNFYGGHPYARDVLGTPESLNRMWVSGTYVGLAALALAIMAYTLADLVHGNVFIAAFVGGLAMGRVSREVGEHVSEFAGKRDSFSTSWCSTCSG